jgi:predicted dehydrogenase
MAQVNWLLVGAGDIARKRVAPALAGAPGSALAAVCDPRLDAALALAADFGGVPVFAELDEALAQSAAEAVYLATPIHLHAGQAARVLGAGRHVLVEKPLGLNAADSADAVRAAAAAGRVAGCAYFRRLTPRYRHAAEMLARGEFGRLVLVRLVYHSWFEPAPGDPKYWRVVRARSGGGPLSDMGSHMFDVLIGLLGLPERVVAYTANRAHAWDVEDTASALLCYADGPQVTASFSWASKAWRHEFEIVGTEAKLNWLPYDTGPVAKTVGRQTENLDLPSADNVHQPLVDDFVQAIREGREPACLLAEAARTNVLMDAIYQSAAEQREIRLGA